MYTEKTVPQCISALNERLSGRGGKYNLDGWTDKEGKFALSLESPVFPPPLPKVVRRTELRAILEKHSGQTVIRGIVPDGVTAVGRAWIYTIIIILWLFMILVNQLVLALILIPLGIALYIPMKGDCVNSELLLAEIQRTLKAKYTPIVTPNSDAGTRRSARSSERAPGRSSTTRRSASR